MLEVNHHAVDQFAELDVHNFDDFVQDVARDRRTIYFTVKDDKTRALICYGTGIRSGDHCPWVVMRL